MTKKNKKVLLGVALLGVAGGVGYWLWKKNKEQQTGSPGVSLPPPTGYPGYPGQPQINQAQAGRNPGFDLISSLVQATPGIITSIGALRRPGAGGSSSGGGAISGAGQSASGYA